MTYKVRGMTNTSIQIWLAVSAAFLAWASLHTITQIGKPREPMKATDAAAGLVIFAAIIVAMVLAAIRL